jgi:hypothetical protein
MEKTLSMNMRTLRFSELVKRHGAPEIKSLWTKPEEDASFMRAVKQGRVLTLFQEANSKHKDSGEIGYHQQPHAAYLVFPKPLDESKGVKVVGIKYELIREPDIQDVLSPADLKKPASKKRNVAEKTRETIPTFNIRIRRIATIETILPIEAKTKSEARRRAVQMAEGQPFDSSEAAIKTEALK